MERPKLKPLDITVHIADDELLPYAKEQLPNRRQEAARRHIQGCSKCSLRVSGVKAKHRIFPYDET